MISTNQIQGGEIEEEREPDERWKRKPTWLPYCMMPKAKVKRRKEIMSKDKSEGVTFNDIFMFMIAVPLVLLWVAHRGKTNHIPHST